MSDYAPKFLPGQNFTMAAAATLVGGNVVFLSAAGQVSPTSGASASVLGVAATDAVTGDKVAVVRGGVQRLVSGGAIAVGDYLKSAANGRVVTATIGTDPQSQVLGQALTAAGASGVTIDALWLR